MEEVKIKPGEFHPHRIIVIGGSAGSLEGLKSIIKSLPEDFNPAIFIVWHMGPDVSGLLPQILNRESKIVASNACDNEVIKANHIYVAPPDLHLLVQEGKLRVTHGPKENRFRPAIDPLFRSAAYAYGNRVIGVILSGGLDDGTAGLWTIKKYGGIAIVQDPNDAQVSSMPESALRQVKVDYIATVSGIAELLVRLSKELVDKNVKIMKDNQTKNEIDIAAEENALQKGVLKYGELTPWSCPECHGVLSKLQDGDIVRYRCHTGHAYSIEALITAITEKIEDSLYSAMRGMDESILLLNYLGDHYAEANQPKLAAQYFKKAKETEERSELVRKTLQLQEQLRQDALRREVMNNSAGTNI